MNAAGPEPMPDMEPVVAVLLRRFDLHLRQLDPRLRVEGDPLRRVYMLGSDILAVISLHRELFRLETGSQPSWEARIRSPEEALDGLAHVLDHYWQLAARQGRQAR